MSLRIAAALVMTVFPLSGSVSGQNAATETTVEIGIERDELPRQLNGFDGGIRGLWRDGRVLIGGQPDESAFKRFQEMGVTVVVNLRSIAEMNDREKVPFDEADVVYGLGMEYVHIPLGGDEHPYTPQAVDRLADVLEDHGGPVLIHCTVAWRASYHVGRVSRERARLQSRRRHGARRRHGDQRPSHRGSARPASPTRVRRLTAHEGLDARARLATCEQYHVSSLRPVRPGSSGRKDAGAFFPIGSVEWRSSFSRFWHSRWWHGLH